MASLFASWQCYAAETIDDLLFASGGPGVGKSTMSNSLIIELKTRGERFRAVSFTGVASSLLTNGATMHSALGLNPSDMYLSCSSLPVISQMSFRDQWQDVKILTIDDISLVPPQLFYLMDQTLREITQLQSPFGGASALLLGDMHQIPPV